MTISDLDYRLPTPFDYGAVGDGSLLSAHYPTVDEAKHDFPNAYALTQSIDWLALEKAIESNPGKTVLITKPLICNFPLLIKNSITLIGLGIGDTNIPHKPVGTPTYTIKGDGASFRTVQTRQRYRGSVNDDPDEAINMAFNVQAAGVTFINIWGHCEGTNWDHHIFSGTRRQLRIISCSLTGKTEKPSPSQPYTTDQLIQRAAVLCDGSQSTKTTRFTHYDGRSYPALAASSADGFEMRGCRTWGCRWDVMALGAAPKPGLRGYGKDYTKKATIIFNLLPLAGDTLTIGEVVFSFVSDSTTVAQEVEIKSTIDDTVQDLLGKIQAMVALGRLDLPKFNSGLYAVTGAQLTVITSDPTTPYFASNWTVSSPASGTRISLPPEGKPETVADFVKYYDEIKGLIVNTSTSTDTKILA